MCKYSENYKVPVNGYIIMSIITIKMISLPHKEYNIISNWVTRTKY